MITTLPRVHVAITGIEKVLPTLEDVRDAAAPAHALGDRAVDLQLPQRLPPAPKRRGRPRRPEHFHVILVDAGRTELVGGDMQAMLRCIRCGACMNHCPVYQNVGGHAYGWVYPGPMGSVLTPAYVGLENALDLPQRRDAVQPVRRRVPGQDPAARSDAQAAREAGRARLRPWSERFALRLWALDRAASAAVRAGDVVGRALLSLLGGRSGRIRSLPGASGWTRERDFPAPRGATFRELYRKARRPG